MMTKSVYPVLLLDISMETIVPESRRCLRRIFFLARHSRNTEARLLSLAESGSALIGASLPRMARGVSYQSKTTNQKERTDSHESSNHFQEFTSYYSPFAIRFRFYRTRAWHPCACPEGGSGKSATGRRLSRRQYRRG